MKSTTEKKLEKGYSVMDNFARSDGLGDCFAELLLCSEDVDRAPLRIVFVFTSMTSVSSSKRRGDIGRLSPWSAPLRMFFSFESFFMMPILSSMISIESSDKKWSFYLDQHCRFRLQAILFLFS